MPDLLYKALATFFCTFLITGIALLYYHHRKALKKMTPQQRKEWEDYLKDEGRW